MLLSEIRNKKMVSLRDAEVLGSVSGVYIDRDTYRVKYIFTNENTTVYAPEKIYAHKDILTVLDACGEPHERASGMLALTIGTAIYGVSGEYAGIVKDVEINSRRKTPVLLTDGKPVKLKHVVASSADAVIINPTGKLLLPPTEKSSRKVLTGTVITPEIPTETAHAGISEAPADYSFLLGRKLKYEVADISRSFVLMAGTLITDRVIANARKAGKIADLVTKSS